MNYLDASIESSYLLPYPNPFPRTGGTGEWGIPVFFCPLRGKDDAKRQERGGGYTGLKSEEFI